MTWKDLKNKIPSLIPSHNSIHVVQSINSRKFVEDFLKTSFILVCKAIILQLTNNTNLFRWKKVFSRSSGLCNTNKQTQLHMLSDCSEAVCNGRYTWCHNSILFMICHYLTSLENIGFKLFADLAGFKNPKILFNGSSTWYCGEKLTVIEQSCCHETNFVKTCSYKIEHYSKLHDLCVD